MKRIVKKYWIAVMDLNAIQSCYLWFWLNLLKNVVAQFITLLLIASKLAFFDYLLHNQRYHFLEHCIFCQFWSKMAQTSISKGNLKTNIGEAGRQPAYTIIYRSFNGALVICVMMFIKFFSRNLFVHLWYVQFKITRGRWHWLRLCLFQKNAD